VFENWHNHFGGKLSIALTDTFGSRTYFDNVPVKQLEQYTGVRQDSGDPEAYAESYLDVLNYFKIDPKTKTVVFSDGLDLEKMENLAHRFGSRLNVVFGWGTNLTNDLGLRPLSIVMKATRVNGSTGTVKLSDNLEKATGSPEDVEKYKDWFGYTNTESETCVY